MKYNYVVFGSEADYYKYGYQELNFNKDTVYYSEPFFGNTVIGKLLSVLRKIHMTPRLNKYVNIPFKYIWNKVLFKNVFSNDKPICFVFFSTGPFSEHIKSGFLAYLKRKFPDSKYVVFYQDLIGSNNRTITVQEYSEMMDVVISFDYKDCTNHGLLYHSLVYSDISKQIKSDCEECDIYFCGAAKNRLDEILKAYKYLTEIGYKCNFNVITKSYEDKQKCAMYEGLQVHESFSYNRNLQMLLKCKYILEIMQKGGTGYTIRACEAIIFNKKLISNNSFLLEANFYNDKDIIVFDSISDIKDLDINSSCSLCEYKQSISPIEFMRFIDYNL